nr:WD40 repeat domain-containing protein [Odoribacter sp.]
MKKGIWLSLGAIVLVGVIVFAVWYINEEGKMRSGSKDSFIPYNSAWVVSVNARPALSPEMEQAFGGEVARYRERLLVRVTETLRHQGYVIAYPYVVAARVEGK